MASALYQQAIMDLAAEAVGHGTLESPSAAALVDNPLCGDRVEMQIESRDGRIGALAHRVRGCLLCRAAASILGKRAPGATSANIEVVSQQLATLLREGGTPPPGWEDLSVFAPVQAHPSRYRCVQLPFEALLQALRQAAPADPAGPTGVGS
jgi:NifU-like protein involved in Fe-S cluster formation